MTAIAVLFVTMSWPHSIAVVYHSEYETMAACLVKRDAMAATAPSYYSHRCEVRWKQ